MTKDCMSTATYTTPIHVAADDSPRRVRPRIVDLFAGAGGLTSGFISASAEPDAKVDFRVVAAVEADHAAAATYAANFGRDHLFNGKIQEWDGEMVPEAEVVLGGPPCQGFSHLGKRDPQDARNLLWMQYADRLARLVHPQYFVMENVPAFLKSPQWDLLLDATSHGGVLRDYELQHFVLNAADFGVPQLRRRAVVIGHHRDLPPVPDPLTQSLSSSGLTVADALAELPDWVDPDSVDLPGRVFEFEGRVLPGAFKTSELHVTRFMSDIVRMRIAAIPPGGDRRNIPEDLLPSCWRTHRTGAFDVMGRLRFERPSVTIRTEFFKPEKGRYLHPVENRPITHAEAAAIQTFPSDYQWCGTKTAIGRQIGNAVPVRLGAALGRLIAGMYV